MEKNPKLGRTLVIIMAVIFLASCLVIFGFWECGLWDKFLAYYDRMSDREWMREAVNSAGWAATMVIVGLQIGQVMFAPIPGELTGFLGGYMFGALNGFLLSTVGLTTGSMINFGIGHFLGERVVRRLVRCETYEKYNEMGGPTTSLLAPSPPTGAEGKGEGDGRHASPPRLHPLPLPRGRGECS